MMAKLTHVILTVADQDEAFRWYTEKLGFEKRADESYERYRWLTVAPKDQKEVEIVLLKPFKKLSPEQTDKLLWQFGGPLRGSCVFSTDDCRKMYETLRSRGVEFITSPQETPQGLQTVFVDPYGNMFTLLEPR